jgi:hypothetical protein
MRDLYIKELEGKRMTDPPSYKKIIEWRAVQAAMVLNASYDPQVVIDGMDVINQKYKAYVFAKRAGYKYENFCIELQNSFEAGHDNFLDDIVEASRRLDNWRVPHVPSRQHK